MKKIIITIASAALLFGCAGESNDASRADSTNNVSERAAPQAGHKAKNDILLECISSAKSGLLMG